MNHERRRDAGVEQAQVEQADACEADEQAGGPAVRDAAWKAGCRPVILLDPDRADPVGESGGIGAVQQDVGGASRAMAQAEVVRRVRAQLEDVSTGERERGLRIVAYRLGV